MENEALVERYEQLSSGLLDWIKQKIAELNERQFVNSLRGVQQQLTAFNTYRVEEKPPRFQVRFKKFIQISNNFIFFTGEGRTRNAVVLTAFPDACQQSAGIFAA